ncbi:hypothetical protein HAX54_045184, partial [Datura stramonium]|nr:hypothetical protein [Datura stramonium]
MHNRELAKTGAAPRISQVRCRSVENTEPPNSSPSWNSTFRDSRTTLAGVVQIGGKPLKPQTHSSAISCTSQITIRNLKKRKWLVEGLWGGEKGEENGGEEAWEKLKRSGSAMVQVVYFLPSSLWDTCEKTAFHGSASAFCRSSSFLPKFA